MAQSVCRDAMTAIASRPPETGGILLGPEGSNDITDFHFDQSAKCTGGTYSPDHVTLRHIMQTQWLPSGIDMKGFIHSHPGRFDRLSEGDLQYIRRLLRANDDMTMFAAPIVIPSGFRMCPYVVLREDPTRPRCARLVLF